MLLLIKDLMNKGWFNKLIRKSQDEKMKDSIRKWLIQINQKEKLPQNIVALNFNLGSVVKY